MRFNDNETVDALVWTRPQSFDFSHTLLFLLLLFLSNATSFEQLIFFCKNFPPGNKAETSGNFSRMDPTSKIQRKWQHQTLNLFKPHRQILHNDLHTFL